MALSVSIITTCKNRLHHLMESLPTWLVQDYPGQVEVIVVDYQCPQKTMRTVNRLWPTVKCIPAYHPKGLFNMSHARNVGASHATGQILAFMDADSVLAPDHVRLAVTQMIENKTQIVVCAEGPVIFGSCYIERGRYHISRGYDESVQDYGHDDIDMYNRIRDQGVPLSVLDSKSMRRINHDDATRWEFFEVKGMSAGPRNAEQTRDTKRVVNPLGYGSPIYGQYPEQ